MGAFLLISIIAFMKAASSPSVAIGVFARPGAFFYLSFRWVSFYIPLYLFAGAFLILIEPFKAIRLYMLTLSIIPFLTLALFVKVLVEPESQASLFSGIILSSVGRVPGAVLVALAVLIEALLLVQLYRFLVSQEIRTRAAVDGDSEQDPAQCEETDPPAAESPRAESVWEPIQDRAGQSVKTGVDWLFGDAGGQDLEGSSRQTASPDSTAEGPLSETAASLSATTECIAETDKDWEGLLEGETGVAAPREAELLSDHPPGTPAEASATRSSLIDTLEHQSFIEDAEFELVSEPAVDSEQERSSGAPQGRPGSGRRASRKYHVPIDGILQDYDDTPYWKIDAETRQAGEVLMKTLGEFKISAELTGIQKGPVITMFEILPSPGVKLSRIVNLADNIALRLAALRVRIVAPIPGKHAVGIEVPNKKRAIVPFKEMITLDKFRKNRYEIPIVLGKDISGEAQIVDLVQTPHLLIAGATGSGKSVCVNSIIASILYKQPPGAVRLLLIDPKIVELKFYNDIPHLLTPVITDPKRSFQALQYCISEMERRYSLLDALEARDIRSYNRKIKKEKLATTELPYIVIVIDEFADLMATTGKEMEGTLARLAAMSRAIGIHLVLATQRPSVDVITGLIKANIPSRIAFMVASKFDSRIIIDTVGAEKLLGGGDMLLTSAWDPVPKRIQGSFLSDGEIEAVTAHVKSLGEPDYIDEEIFFDEDNEDLAPAGEDDPLYDNALEIVIAAGKASASYLQRRLKIGYNRAARLVEHMEMRGIVGPPNGSKPREILHVPDRH